MMGGFIYLCHVRVHRQSSWFEAYCLADLCVEQWFKYSTEVAAKQRFEGMPVSRSLGRQRFEAWCSSLSMAALQIKGL